MSLKAIVTSTLYNYTSNRLLHNALNLMLSSGIISLFGFIFWIIIARNFTSQDIGVATTLIASALLVALLSQSGFDTTFIRFLSKSKNKSEYINTGLVISGLTSIIIATAYCFIVPRFSTDLSFLSNNPLYMVGFVLFALFATWNTLTNAALIAYRRTRYILIIDTIFSIVKISLPFLITSGGAMAIFIVVGIAQVVNVALSLFVLIKYFGYKPKMMIDRGIISDTKRYSAGVYSSSVINLLPDSLLPLIVINQLDASNAAYFYIAFAIANLVYTIVFAITQALLAETANDEKHFREHARKGIKFAILLLTPVIVAVIILAPYILKIFGDEYAAGGVEMLRIMALSGYFVMGYSFLSFYYKHSKRLLPLVIMTSVNAIVILGLSIPLSNEYGLAGVGWAWMIGTAIAVAVGYFCYYLFQIFDNRIVLAKLTNNTSQLGGMDTIPNMKSKNGLKILRIVSAGYEQGGAENGIVLTNAILRRRGHVIKVISSDVGKGYKHYSDYEFTSVPERGIRKFFTASFNIDAYIVTRKVLSEFNPDVVLLHTMSQPTASVLFLLKKYPTLQFVHGPELFTKSLIPWYLALKDYKNGTYLKRDLTFLGKLHYLYFRYISGLFYSIGLRNVNQFVALSSYTETVLKDEGHLPIKFIPNGAMAIKYNSSFPIKHTILYVGRLEKFKGVDDLIRAMPEIIRSIPDVKLIIAGEGSLSRELHNIVDNLNVCSNVTFLGHLDRDQVSKQYQNCSVLIMPSIWPETFGKVGIEAMIAGKPVIATNVGGVCDWLNDGVNGFLIEPNNPTQIAEKVTIILNDKTLYKKMSSSAKTTSRKFSMEKFAFNIEQLCLDITKEK